MSPELAMDFRIFVQSTNKFQLINVPRISDPGLFCELRLT